MGLLDRFQKAWNAFLGKGPPYDETNLYKVPKYIEYGRMSTNRPDRIYYSKGQERTLVNAIYNRIALDVSAIDIRHIKVNKENNNRYEKDVDSSINDILTFSANKDQTGRQLIQDIVMSMFDEGCVAVVPIDYDDKPEDDAIVNDILTMRTGKITKWYPDDVEVEIYNDILGTKQLLTVPKIRTAIIENPFYAVMNEPNSVVQRLIKKYNLLDMIDTQSASGKLNLIIQLPYVIKTEARKKQAADRRADIESQLADSQYGIAYTDGTEKVMQLNRPADNNLLAQIQFLTSMFMGQLGVTDEILNGTADAKTMQNYFNRTVEPICKAITEEFSRKFITKTGRTQGQRISYFNQTYKLISIDSIPDFADKMTRNEILSSNEVRELIGMLPSDSPEADELRNKNLNKNNVEQETVSEEESAAKAELALLKKVSKNNSGG